MQNNDTKKLPADWFDIVFLGGVVFIGWCKINDPLFVCGILSTLFLLWKWRKSEFRFSKTDRLILILWGFQIVNLFFSIEPISGFFSVKTLTFSIIFYFLLRISLNNASKVEKFLFVVCVLIFVTCAVALITFLLFRSACIYVEFTGLYDFRHLYRPLGYLSNVWGSLLIMFTGIVLLALHLCRLGKTRFVFLIFLLGLLVWNITASFSRGVYMAFAFLLLAYSFFLIFSAIDRTRKIWIFVTLAFSLLITGFAHRQDVIKILQFNKSLSQQRSIAGRMGAMSSSYELFKKSPLTGTGAGTYQQVINAYRYEDDDVGFTSFAPNGYAQLLVEQGIIGLILWASLFLFVFAALFRKRKELPIAMILLILLTAVLIREATFPVLLENVGFQLSIFTALAVFQYKQPTEKISKASAYRLYFPVVALISSLLISAFSIYYMREERNNRQALSEMEAGRPEKAKAYILKTSERTPYLINRFLVCDELYRETKKTEYLNHAENYLQKAAQKNPNDVMLTYYQASILRKRGKHEAALTILTELAQKFPNKSLYQLSVFDMLYRNGQQEKAFPYLVQAVKLAPDLLDGTYLKEIFSKDANAMQQSLNSILLQDISNEEVSVDPIFLAKSGKVFLSLGLEKEAKSCLEKSILLLPNLIYPHYYLSQIEAVQYNFEQSIVYLKQFVFLQANSLSKQVIDRVIDSEEIDKLFIRREKNIDHSYKVRFKTWYHSSTIVKQFIP
ncbi:MAG: O-antigen ligase family protein [Bacteroidales bacterium]|jgi:O-antigen ligase|nr:O-antigen ligase family protein [Bacteroidales bacterium]